MWFDLHVKVCQAADCGHGGLWITWRLMDSGFIDGAASLLYEIFRASFTLEIYRNSSTDDNHVEKLHYFKSRINSNPQGKTSIIYVV